MPGYFLDSSAPGKRYHPEVGSAHVDALVRAPQLVRFISRLSVVELQSVFAGKVRTQAIAEADLELLRARFLQDIARLELRVVRMTDAHYRGAEQLIQQHGVRRSLRTLDALQLSVALTRHRRVTLEALVCTDEGLCYVAQEEGLHIINPEIL
jgi:hypothetical protein